MRLCGAGRRLSERRGGSIGEQTGEKTALITGVAGQDGATLTGQLLEKGYRVTGAFRQGAPDSFWRLEAMGIRDHPRLALEPLDLADPGRCLELVQACGPAEIYNLGGLSFIGQSFTEPLRTAQTTALGAMNLLEAIRVTDPRIRFCQASSSEMFGHATVSPQNEDTPFHPRSPYAVAKLFAHWAAVTYRESYGMFAASAILFNHESPLRGTGFVTRKISEAVARIRLGLQEVVELGNLDARRDWGYAPEYMDGIWRMLQAEAGDSFVLATGRLTTVREFAERAFRAAGIELRWQGVGWQETGHDARSGAPRVRVSAGFFRPAETQPLCGDPRKAARVLGWRAATQVDEICRRMVEADLKRLGAGEKRAGERRAGEKQ